MFQMYKQVHKILTARTTLEIIKVFHEKFCIVKVFVEV